MNSSRPTATVRPHWNPLVDSLSAIGHGGLARPLAGRPPPAPRQRRHLQRLWRPAGYRTPVAAGSRAARHRRIANGAASRPPCSQRATLLNAMLADLYGPQQSAARRICCRPNWSSATPAFCGPAIGVRRPGGDLSAHLCGRPRALARRPLVGPRRSHAGALRRRLRAGKSPGLDARARPTSFAPRRCAGCELLPGLSRDPAQPRPAPSRKPAHRAADARALQRNLFRACVPRALSGLHAGRRRRPHCPRQLGLSENARRPAAGRSDHAPPGRQLLRSARTARRFDARRCRPAAGRARPAMSRSPMRWAPACSNRPRHAAFLPSLCQHMLGEDLKMPSVATWWCGQQRAAARMSSIILPSLVIKPAFPDHRQEPIFGARLSAKQREKLARPRCARIPDDYVAQEQVALSTVPVGTSDSLQPRHFVLRVYLRGRRRFLCGDARRSDARDHFARQPGGLDAARWRQQRYLGAGRSADAANSAYCGRIRRRSKLTARTIDLPSRIADNLFWLGRYVERVEMVVRLARAILSRVSQESDPLARRRHRGRLSRPRGVWATSAPNPSRRRHRAANARGARDDLRFRVARRPRLESASGAPRRLAAARSHLRRCVADSQPLRAGIFRRRAPAEPLRISAATNLLDHAIITLSAFSGLVMESMTRGHGWRFLDIGRRLERAIQMVDLIRYGLGYRARHR